MSKEKDRQPFISVRDLKKYFCLDNYKLAKAKTRYIHAVDDVSFDIYKGEIFGIIGESGSGKSTIGRCVLKLIDVDSGEIYFDGKNITHVSRKEQQELRSRMQMVFQNPLASFDPKKTIRFSLEESAKVHKIKPEVYKARIKQLMEYIALPEDLLTRYPKDLSGGQLQRLAIARALMLEPDFILADEPVSALDVSVQAQILNLMLDLKEDKGQTILFISHDLNVVRHVCDRIAVVYLGAVMEMGTVEQVYNSVLTLTLRHLFQQSQRNTLLKIRSISCWREIYRTQWISPRAVALQAGADISKRACATTARQSSKTLETGITLPVISH